MSDAFWTRLVLVVVIIVVVSFIRWIAAMIRSSNDGGAQAEEQGRSWAEARAISLLEEFPQMSDEQIAQVMRDELMNHRVKNAHCFTWASSETVARLRRTIALEKHRQR